MCAPGAPELSFSCQLKTNKDYHFKVENDENEQLSLGRVSFGAGAKGEVHTLEGEAA